jgi:hypothetical protein
LIGIAAARSFAEERLALALGEPFLLLGHGPRSMTAIRLPRQRSVASHSIY